MKNELPPARPKTNHEKDLVAAAKRVVNAQLRRRKARRELIAIEGEIKLARKLMRAMLVAALNSDDQLPPRFARYAPKTRKGGK